MRYVDEVKCVVEAGKGGDGCISFRREKYVPRGGPDGGDGGDGGSIYFVGDRHLTTLYDFLYRPRIKAENGEHGKGKNRHGRKGRDVYIKVPLGTDVYDEEGNLIGSIMKHGEKLLVARGGKGGRGNASFATPQNRAPRIRETGKPGEKKTLLLKLRLIADIGLVGFPNAGKSTLLKCLSNAKPRVAPYPFTTLAPNLGVMEDDEIRITVADIPGIIEDAHKGKGLGLKFLKAIERTKALVYVIDATSPSPLKDYEILKKELEQYNPALLKKPSIVVFNKADLLKRKKKIKGLDNYIYISALYCENVKKLIKWMEEVMGEQE